jgi:hypothetical protein
LTHSLLPAPAFPAWSLIALYIIASALISLLSVLCLKEYAGQATEES